MPSYRFMQVSMAGNRDGTERLETDWVLTLGWHSRLRRSATTDCGGGPPHAVRRFKASGCGGTVREAEKLHGPIAKARGCPYASH